LKKQNDPILQKKNRRLSADRRKKRRSRMEAAVKSDQINKEIGAKASLEVKAMRQSKKASSKILDNTAYRRYLKGAPSRQEEKTKEHRLELHAKYDKIIEEFRLKEGFTKDSEFSYDPKKKHVNIIKGTLKPRARPQRGQR